MIMYYVNNPPNFKNQHIGITCISADKIGEADKRDSGVSLDLDLMSIVYDIG